MALRGFMRQHIEEVMVLRYHGTLTAFISNRATMNITPKTNDQERTIND
jgi:hypothetical protein